MDVEGVERRYLGRRELMGGGLAVALASYAAWAPGTARADESAWSNVATVTGARAGLAMGPDVVFMGQPDAAPTSDGGDRDKGLVFVHTRQGDGSWPLTQVLQGSDAIRRARFGRAVAYANGLLAVGAPYDGRDGRRGGSVFLFRLIDGEWTEVGKYDHPGGLLGDSVATNGLFVASGSSIFHSHALEAPVLTWESGSEVGYMGMHRDLVAIGKQYSGVSLARKGPNGWEQQPDIDAGVYDPDGSSGRSLRSIAVRNGRIYVGDPRYSASVSNQGAVHVLEQDGGTWRRTRIITPEQPVKNDRFGTGLAVDDDRLVSVGPQVVWVVDDPAGTPAQTARLPVLHFPLYAAVNGQDFVLNTGALFSCRA